MVLDISNSSDEGSDSDTEIGETVVVNKSQWDDPSDDRDESTVTETEDTHRDNGEGPSRPPQAASGSPDDDGDDSDDNESAAETERSFRDNGEGPSKRPRSAGSSDSGYSSSDQHFGDESDSSVMPEILDGSSEDYDTFSDDETGKIDWTLWPLEILQVKYSLKLDKIRNIRREARRRLDEVVEEKTDRINELRAIIEDRDEEIEHQETVIGQLQNQIQAANTQHQIQIQRLEDRLSRVRDPPTPWTQLWQRGVDYSLVYKEACKQLNMSQLHTNIHPQLTISSRWLNNATLRAAYDLNNADDDDEDGNGNRNEEGGNSDSDNESELFVRQNSVPPVDSNRPFNFNGLPRDIQERIFRYIFVKTDLVHCLSRLDPSNRPLTPRPLNRFFWGGNRGCVVSLAHRPNNVLRLLLVCKRWLYLGVHAFYGLNTFAFSSLGELGRFMKGIGSRMERIVNIELFWHGAVMPRHPSRINQRTVPLQYFCDTRRLRTLVIHIQERDQFRARRGYEKREEDAVGDGSGVPYDGSRIDTQNPFKVMTECTRIQPNYRPNRSIRTVHGLDYIYQLRGMNYIKIREAQGDIAREPIRDWSVIDDINAVVTRSKAPEYARLSELPNLTPIGGIGEFVPNDDDMHIVRRWYADNEPMGSIVGEDDDGDTISIVSNDTPALPDDDDDESESDDDPDTPSDDGEGSDADVDIGDDDMDVEDDASDKTIVDMDVDSGVEDMDMDMDMDDPVDDINEVLEQMDMQDESSSIDNNAEESETEREDSDNDEDDEVCDDNDNGNEDHSRREWSSLFVRQNDDTESSLFVRSQRASTHVKTDSDEEKHKVIDLTGDDAEVKEEGSGGSVIEGHGSSLPGSSRDAPMDVDEYDEKRFSDAESVSSSWKGGASSTSSRRRGHSPYSAYHGSDDASSPKRMRFNSPGSSRESAISIEED